MAGLQHTRRAFSAILAGCYLAAFASLHAQLPGLLGRNGLLPVTVFLGRVRKQLGSRGGKAGWSDFPTLIWWHEWIGLPEDSMAELVALAGMLLSACVLVQAVTTPSGAPMVSWAALWALYLSLYSVGQTFLSFQWDILLMEVGFAAIWLAPMLVGACVCVQRVSSHSPPALPMVWVVRFILFKLMLMSGVVKMQAQCPTWLQLTALKYHFATQCIPTPLAWITHHLPAALQHWGVAVTLWVEGPACWLLLCPLRKPRIFGAALQILLQVLILLTGNYNFFNWLTIALAVIHLDDGCFLWSRRKEEERAAPKVALGEMQHEEKPASVEARKALSKAQEKGTEKNKDGSNMLKTVENGLSTAIIVAAVCTLFVMVKPGVTPVLRLTVSDLEGWLEVLLPWTLRYFWCVILPFVSLQHMWNEYNRSSSTSAACGRVLNAGVLACGALVLFAVCAKPFEQIHPSVAKAFPPVDPHAHTLAREYHLASGYGLFRRMTGVGRRGEVARPEVIIEGSADGKSWLPYEFRYKPGEVHRPPPWVAPHQPRLDWQMWFAALGSYHHNPWLVHLCVKLLQGSPEVVDLLDVNALPFPVDSPPRVIRAHLYEYDFASPNSTDVGAWWTREFKGEWLPEFDIQNESVQLFMKQHQWLNTSPAKGLPKPGALALDNLIHRARWPAGFVLALVAGGAMAWLQVLLESLCVTWMLEGLVEGREGLREKRKSE